MYLNNQQVYNSNGLYGHKALISNEFNASTRNNEGILACHGYELENETGDYEKCPFIDREKELLLKDGSTHQTVCYNFMKTIARTFNIPSGQIQFIQENVFIYAAIRRIAITMKTNSAFTEIFQEISFLSQKFGLRELRIFRGGRVIVSLDTTNDCRTYGTTMKAMNLSKEFPALPNHQFEKHYILVFDHT